MFFRDRGELDHAAQIAFGRQFGELTYAHPHDDFPPDGYPEIYTVDPRRFEQRYGLEKKEREAVRKYSYTSGWHTDVTPAHNPPAGSILRADVVPGYGGDTTFTNLVAAYEGLLEPVRTFVDSLWAEHRYGAGYGGQRRTPSGLNERISKNSLVSNHPVVRVHPKTGERALFVNPGFVDPILDVDPLESRWILDHLFAEISGPSTRCGFDGNPAVWPSGTTGPLRTRAPGPRPSRRRTRPCTGSR